MGVRPASGSRPNTLLYEITTAHGIAAVYIDSYSVSGPIQGYAIKNSSTEYVKYTVLMYLGSALSGSLEVDIGALSPGSIQSSNLDTSIDDMHHMLIFW